MAKNRWELEENRKKKAQEAIKQAIQSGAAYKGATPQQVTQAVTGNKTTSKSSGGRSSGKTSSGTSRGTSSRGSSQRTTSTRDTRPQGARIPTFLQPINTQSRLRPILRTATGRVNTPGLRTSGGFGGGNGTGVRLPRAGDSTRQQRQSDLDQLTANSIAWHFADDAQKQALFEANNAIREQYGLSYNPSTGETYNRNINLSEPVANEVSRQRSYNEQTPLSVLGHNLGAGLAGINRGFYSTLDFLLPDFMTPNAVQEYINKAKTNAEDVQEKVREYNYSRGGTVGGVAGDLLQSAVGAVPQVVIALMSGGLSTAGQLGSEASGLVSTISNQLTKNSGYLSSFLSTVGTDYERAKANGASDTEAALSAILSSAATAGIETAGGIDVPAQSTSRIRNAARTALEEGGEEVLQGVAQNTVQAFTDPSIGVSDILNPAEMAQNFAGGTLLGGTVGLGRRPVNAPVRTETQTNTTPRAQTTINTSQQTAAPDTINIGDAQVERSAGQITSPTAALANDPLRANAQNIGFTPLNLESTLNRLNPMSKPATRAMRNVQRVYPQPSQRVQPTLQTAQHQRIQPTLQGTPSMNALRQAISPESSVGAATTRPQELEGTTFGANTVGAAQSGFKPQQRASKVITNTFRNSHLFNEAEKHSLKILNDEGEALYDVVTERQSLQNAQDRLESDYDGEVQYLSEKPNFSGEDNDTAMGVLSHKISDARVLGDPTDEAAKEKYDDVSTWVKMIADKGTEGGQFIQSFAKYSRTPEGIVVQGQREIDAALKYWEKKNPKQVAKLQRQGYLIWTNEDIQKSYDLMQKAEEAGIDTRQGLIYEAQAMRVIADRLPTSNKDKVVSLLMDNMLGNFRTLVARNTGGNALFAIPEGLRQQLIEAPLDAIVSAFTKSRTTYFSPLQKTGAWAKGLTKGATDMASDIKHGVHTARSGEQNSVRSQQRTFRNKGLGRLGNLYDAGVGTMLEIGDRPFYEAAYASAMADLEKARDRGRLTKDFEGKDFDTYAPQVARHAALEAVFQNDGLVARGLTKAAEAIGDISRGITGTGALRQSAIPFTKTPGNLAERAIEYSPLGGLKNAAQTVGEIKTGNFDQRRFVRETSRNLVGTLLFLAAGGLVEGGVLGGQLSDDKDEKEAQKNAGMQDYAIKIGDKYYSYSWIPVIGPALAGSADFYQILNNTDKDIVDAMWEAAEGYIQSAVFEQSALSNLEEMFSGYGGTMDNIGSTLASVSSQLVPSLIRQVATATDPYERQTYVSGDTLQSQLNYLKSTIPGLRQTLPIKRDEQGNEKLSSQGRGLGSRILENMFLPAKITADQSNAVRDELLRLKKSTGEVSQFQNKATYAVERDGQKVSLTPYQSMEYQSIYGQMSTQAIEDLMNSGVYDELSDAQKVKVITEINSYAKSVADSEFVNVSLDTAQQKAHDAQEMGIGVGLYYAFKDGMNNIQEANKGKDDSAALNVGGIVDMMESEGFADLTEEQKDFLFNSGGYSLAMNPYHISAVEKSAQDNAYYKNLSAEDDLYYFRSLANEYEDAVQNGKSLDGWIAKAKLAADNNVVEPYQFVALKHALLYADTDENGSYKQDEVTAAIRSLSGLSDYQKAYLWQAQNKKWKPESNPFGYAEVYWPETEETDNSAGAVISRRVDGMGGTDSVEIQHVSEPAQETGINPVAAGPGVRLGSTYGYREAPTAGASTFHEGNDIPAPMGTPVVAYKSGTVSFVGDSGSGGNMVQIDHPDGTKSVYLHLQDGSFQVSPGQTVSQGQQIANVGSTGISTGPHLDFRIMVNGKYVDPQTYYPGY